MNRTGMLTAFLLALASPAGAFDLVRDGKATAIIVTPAEPLASVARAAWELQYHVEKASGAKLAIVKEGAEPVGDRPCVYVGGCKAAGRAGVSAEGLPRNGSIIRTVGPDLFLIGRDTRGNWLKGTTHVGTLFAVYELLDRDFGVRWLWPGPTGEVIPRRTTLRIAACDRKIVQPLPQSRLRTGLVRARGQGWTTPAARNRFKTNQDIWMRRHRLGYDNSLSMGHSFTRYWAEFGKTHPEFFSLLPDGTRGPKHAPSRVTMCVSEPGLWKAVVKKWAGRRSAARPNINISENDSFGRCICPKCLAWDEPDPALETPWDKRLERTTAAFRNRERNWYKHLGSLSDRYARFQLAVQKEAEKIAPNATVMGYIYANYVQPPRKVKLNRRIILGYVPPFICPYSEAKSTELRKLLDGWSKTGCRFVFRPNFMLAGHNMPFYFARRMGQDFGYLFRRGLQGADYDSLTGQYGTQGPNLYVLARIQQNGLTAVERILDEFYGAFGPAEPAVREYFALWERICEDADVKLKSPEAFAKSRKPHSFSAFYTAADVIFTPQAMSRGRALLDRARSAARTDAQAAARVAFLWKGFHNADLTLKTQVAYRKYSRTADIAEFVEAVRKLDEFRVGIEMDGVANMAWLAYCENQIWNRKLLTMLRGPRKALPKTWKFMWDPRNQGVEQRWFAPDMDDSAWHDIGVDGPWERQDVGRRWRQQHGPDYNGVAWYRTRFETARPPEHRKVALIFGAVDEACTVWLNGRKVLRRPYPYRKNPNSWREAFAVDVTPHLRFDRPNVLAVAVEDNSGVGGIWRPVWVVGAGMSEQ